MSWYFTPEAGNNIETKRLTLDDGVGNQTALTCEIQHCIGSLPESEECCLEIRTLFTEEVVAIFGVKELVLEISFDDFFCLVNNTSEISTYNNASFYITQGLWESQYGLRIDVASDCYGNISLVLYSREHKHQAEIIAGVNAMDMVVNHLMEEQKNLLTYVLKHPTKFAANLFSQ